MILTHLDLFSGIGGFSIGFEREGIKTIAFCENDSFCQSVLRKNWPNVPIYSDINNYSGFPLPRFVNGGEESGTRRLEELVDVRTNWLVVENIQQAWRQWVPELRCTLWDLGLSSVPLQLSAAEVGGCHLRRRIFVVAHADSERVRKLSGWWQREGGKVANELAQLWDSTPRRLGAHDELSDWTYRRKSLGNAVVTGCAQLIARAIISVEKGES